MYNSIVVSSPSPKPHNWAGECASDILHTACATASTASWADVIYYASETQGSQQARRDVHAAEVCNRECTELFNTKQGLGER